MQASLTVDCTGISSEAEFWQRYLDIAQPDGASIFGRNLDAFWDAVEGGGPGHPGEVEVRFSNSAALSVLSNGRFLQGLRKIARDTSKPVIKLD